MQQVERGVNGRNLPQIVIIKIFHKYFVLFAIDLWQSWGNKMIKPGKKIHAGENKKKIEHAGENKIIKVSMIIHAHFWFKKVTIMGKSKPTTVIFCTHCFTFSLETATVVIINWKYSEIIVKLNALIKWASFSILHFDHNFRKPSESAISEPFFMATCVSFYSVVGNLDVYSVFYSFFISGHWLDLFQISYSVTI